MSAVGAASLVAFAAAALAAGLGRAVTTSYLPVLLDRIGTSPGVIGSMMLVNAAAGFAVPLAVGIWSDRLRARGHGRTMPFVLGGSLLGAGGLAAIAFGSESSFLALALFGAVTYVGLNAVTTAHRALIPENFSPAEHAKATGAQEFAMLVGGLAGVAVGGVLVELTGWLPFALAAAALPLFALPTVLRMRGRERREPEPGRDSRSPGYYLRAASRPSVRALLAAQILWVLGYAALPSFFILYAGRVLGLRPSVAGIWLVAFGVATGATMLAAGRARRVERHRPFLLLGVALMGGGFLAVAATSSLLLVGPGLLAAAVGFGLVSTIGFPLYASLIPKGEVGVYTALYFSVRAISSAVALPAAGWAIAATGSYRALFVLGGAVTLAALVPLSRVARLEAKRRRRLALATRLPSRQYLARWAGAVAALYGLTLGAGLLSAATGLHRLDEAAFRALNALGPGPRPLFQIVEEPQHVYLLIVGVALVAAVFAGRRRLPGVLALIGLSIALAWTLLEALYAVYDRARPSEVFDPSTIVLAYGRTWASIESFPSGHMVVATALAAAAWLAFPRLRLPLALFVGLTAVTRVLFGAHFPLDVLAGAAFGYASARAAFALLVQAGLLDKRAPPQREPCAEPGCRGCLSPAQ